MTVAMDLSSLHCLIVDDNANMRKLIATILYSLGIKNIREASDGAEAIEVLGGFPADIVILDWVMSPEDGITFTRHIRSETKSPNPYLPIIMLTGHTEMSRIEEARDAGVTEFLSKPVSVKGLVQRIVNIIDKPRPFVHCPSYFGPTRRRRDDPDYAGPERRQPVAAGASN